MKPKNFPLRKLIRKTTAENKTVNDREIEEARNKRTKKNRGGAKRFHKRRAKISMIFLSRASM